MVFILMIKVSKMFKVLMHFKSRSCGLWCRVVLW